MKLTGFNIEQGQNGREIVAVMNYAIRHGLPVASRGKGYWNGDGWLPVGSVAYCESALGHAIMPNYLPPFLSKWVTRRVWEADTLPAENCYVKPADQYKRFTACLASEAKDQPGPFLCSEVIEIEDEWRYYVADGKVVASGWYAGEHELADAPEINMAWPVGYCGAVDFALLKCGQIELLESHHPFACGWYGESGEDYVHWLVAGWASLVSSCPA